MHEHEHAEPVALRPERLELRRIDELALGLGRDDHAGKAEFVFAAVHSFKASGPPSGLA